MYSRRELVSPAITSTELVPSSAEDVHGRLLRKEGVPELNQRLVFSSLNSNTCTVSSGLEELRSLQAILFRNGKSIGRLTNAKLQIDSLPGTSASAVALLYREWQPVGAVGSSVPVRIEVDGAFSSSTFEARVLGRLQAQPFQGPAYFVSGREAAASVSQHLQRLEYIQRQRERHHSGSGVPADQQSRHIVKCGEGLRSVELSFKLDTQRAWLDGLAFNLAYLVSGAVDDPAVPAAAAAPGRNISSGAGGPPPIAEPASARLALAAATRQQHENGGMASEAPVSQHSAEALLAAKRRKAKKKRAGASAQGDTGDSEDSGGPVSMSVAGSRLEAALRSGGDACAELLSSSSQGFLTSVRGDAADSDASSAAASALSSFEPGSPSPSDDYVNGVSDGGAPHMSLHSAPPPSRVAPVHPQPLLPLVPIPAGKPSKLPAPPLVVPHAVPVPGEPLHFGDLPPDIAGTPDGPGVLSGACSASSPPRNGSVAGAGRRASSPVPRGQPTWHRSVDDQIPAGSAVSSAHPNGKYRHPHHPNYHQQSPPKQQQQQQQQLERQQELQLQQEEQQQQQQQLQQQLQQPPPSPKQQLQQAPTEQLQQQLSPKQQQQQQQQQPRPSPKQQEKQRLSPKLSPKQPPQLNGSAPPAGHVNGALTPELLAAYNLAAGPLNGDMGPSVERLRTHLSSAAPFLLTEVALPRQTPPPVLAAGGAAAPSGAQLSPVTAANAAAAAAAAAAALVASSSRVAWSESRSGADADVSSVSSSHAGSPLDRRHRVGGGAPPPMRRNGDRGSGGPRGVQLDRVDSMSDPGGCEDVRLRQPLPRGPRELRGHGGAAHGRRSADLFLPSPPLGGSKGVAGEAWGARGGGGPRGAAQRGGGGGGASWLGALPPPSTVAEQTYQQQLLMLQYLQAAQQVLPHGLVGAPTNGGHGHHHAAPPPSRTPPLPPMQLPPAALGPPAPDGSRRHGGGAQHAATRDAGGPSRGASARTTDLQRFLSRVTPQLPLRPALRAGADGGKASALTLADVWGFYEEPSMVGCEVATVGGARGPSNAYFVPYLSALQLFAAVGSSHPADQSLYLCDVEGWPRLMRLVAQHVEHELPFNREPMHAQLEALAAAPGGGALLSTRLADLHPASWYAVAWYPVYRIPDAPLLARFLTFHSLGSVPLAASTPPRTPGGGDAASGSSGKSSEVGSSSSSGGGATSAPLGSPASAFGRGVGGSSDGGGGGGGGSHSGGSSGSASPGVVPSEALCSGGVLPVHVVGLKWYNMHSEHWLQPLAEPPAELIGAPGWDAEPAGAGGADAASWAAPLAEDPVELHARLSELQATAERMARAQGLKVLRPGTTSAQPVELRVPDFEFFHARGS